MKTVGNDLVRNQLHNNREWYLGLGIILVILGAALLLSLPFATLSVVVLFGIVMMFGGVLHLLMAFKSFSGGFRWLWAIFGILYLIAGYYAFTTPVKTAIVLTDLLAIVLIIAGIIRIANAVLFRQLQGWGWTLFSGVLTLLAGIVIWKSADAPFWVLGLFLAIDILFQGINYLSLASYIRRKVPESSTTID